MDVLRWTPRHRAVAPCVVLLAAALVMLPAPPALGPAASSARGAAYHAAGAQQPLGPLPDKLLFTIGDHAEPPRWLAGAVDIDVSPDGAVHVTDEGNHRLQRFNGSGALKAVQGSIGTAEGMFYRPQRIAAAGDGSFAVADATGRVQWLDADGSLRTVIRLRTAPTVDPIQGYGVPEGIDFVDQRTLVVLDSGRVRRFDELGVLRHSWTIDDASAFRPTDVAAEPGGTLVISGRRSIRRYTPAAELIDEWGALDGVERYYGAVDVDAAGRVAAVVGTYGGPVFLQVFTPAGELAKAATIAADAYRPRVAWARRDVVAVSYHEAHRRAHVVMHDLQAGTSVKWQLPGVPWARRLRMANDVAVAPDGSIVTTDWCCMARFSPDGALVASWGEWGSEAGQLHNPMGVDIGPGGDVYVADRGNDRVQRFAADGEVLGAWGVGAGAYPGPESLWDPLGLAVSDAGDVYVTENRVRPGKLLRYSSKGTRLAAWATQGPAHHYFGVPAVAVSALEEDVETVFALSNADVQVERYTTDGAPLGVWSGAAAPVAARLEDPVAIAAGDDGSVYVADRACSGGACVKRFDVEGGFDGAWVLPGEGPAAFSPQTMVAGLAVDDRSAQVARVLLADTANFHSIASRGRIHVYGVEHLRQWRTEYFEGPWLAGWPLAVVRTTDIDFTWPHGPPGPPGGSDWSMRSERVLNLPAGYYTFTADVAGGVRVWAGERLAIDEWRPPGQPLELERHEGRLLLGPGEHRVRVEYLPGRGEQALQLTWTRSAPPFRSVLPAVRTGGPGASGPP